MYPTNPFSTTPFFLSCCRAAVQYGRTLRTVKAEKKVRRPSVAMPSALAPRKTHSAQTLVLPGEGRDRRGRPARLIHGSPKFAEGKRKKNLDSSQLAARSSKNQNAVKSSIMIVAPSHFIPYGAPPATVGAVCAASTALNCLCNLEGLKLRRRGLVEFCPIAVLLQDEGLRAAVEMTENVEKKNPISSEKG